MVKSQEPRAVILEAREGITLIPYVIDYIELFLNKNKIYSQIYSHFNSIPYHNTNYIQLCILKITIQSIIDKES